MALFETIIGWWSGGKPPLARLPFEELCSRYRSEPGAVFEEFTKRLSRIIIQAASNYVARHDPPISSVKVNEMVMKVFQDFAPQFASGNPNLLLVEFAGAIRRVLDSLAFEKIARRYYFQLPIYHLKDDQQRRVLAMAYERGVGPTVSSEIANVTEIPVEQVSRLLKEGNSSLREVITRDFTSSELSRLTEGYLKKEMATYTKKDE